MASAILRQLTVFAARFGRSVATAWKHLTPSGWGARLGEQQAFRQGPLLHHFLLAPTLLSLFWTSGSADTSREVYCTSTRATLSWTSSSQFSLPRQPSRKGTRIWLRVAPFPLGLPRQQFLRVRRDFFSFPESQRFARTRHAKDTGWKSCQLHQTSEEFLNCEVTSEVPGVLMMGGAGGANGAGRRTQWGSPAKLLRVRSRPPWTIQAPRASQPRKNGNVGRFGVGARSSDDVSGIRSGLNPTFYPSSCVWSFQASRKTTKHSQVCARTEGRVHPTDRAREGLFGACAEADAADHYIGARLEGAQPKVEPRRYDASRTCCARATSC